MSAVGLSSLRSGQRCSRRPWPSSSTLTRPAGHPPAVYNPNGGNGAQTGAVGVCGDSFEGGTGPNFFASKPFNEYRIALPTYTTGGRIRVRIDLSANHGGKFGFKICPRTSNLTPDCFAHHLTRADVPGERWFWMQSGERGARSPASG